MRPIPPSLNSFENQVKNLKADMKTQNITQFKIHINIGHKKK